MTAMTCADILAGRAPKETPVTLKPDLERKLLVFVASGYSTTA